MGSLNKVMLIGRLGKDPEIKYTPTGSAVANFSIATTENWADKQGQRQEKTEWHDIVLWNKLADLAQSYLKKGSQVYLEGRLQTRTWEDQAGQKRYRTEVIASTLQFLDSKTSNQEATGYGAGASQSSVYTSGMPQQQPAATQSHPSASIPPHQGTPVAPAPTEAFIEDDVPF